MALAPVDSGAGGTSTDPYRLEASRSDYEVKGNNLLVPIEEITATSTTYGVTFTFNVTAATFNADGARNLAQEKVAQIDEIAQHAHVIAMRSEQDQGNDGNLYNYLVITVGTDDGLITTDVRQRMDLIGEPSTFSMIDHAWTLLQNLGA